MAPAFSKRPGQQIATRDDGVSYALSTGEPPSSRANHVLTEEIVRRLTPRECERLQGFPDDWTRYDADGKELSDSARYRQMGNAVAVPVVEWIARRLMAVIEQEV